MPDLSALAVAVPHWLVAAFLGVGLDFLFGEVTRFHPLVGFGHWANRLEQWLNPNLAINPANANPPPDQSTHPLTPGLWYGVLAWGLAVLPWVLLAAWLHSLAPLLTDTLLLYFALGARSLSEHAQAIVSPLQSNDLVQARLRVSYLVSRETNTLDASGVALAGTESVLENGHDAVFATLFWFAIGGGPAALLFRLANTLDAMWGYRTPRLKAFGCFSARVDDGLGFFSARLTALTYALCGQFRNALLCWKQQAPQWGSPNAGPVMAAGAGSLGVQLGGPACYHGHMEERPSLGLGKAPQAADLARAIRLIQQGLLLWLAGFTLLAFFAGS